MSASIRELDNIDDWIKEWDNFDQKLSTIKVINHNDQNTVEYLRKYL